MSSLFGVRTTPRRTSALSDIRTAGTAVASNQEATEPAPSRATMGPGRLKLATSSTPAGVRAPDTAGADAGYNTWANAWVWARQH